MVKKRKLNKSLLIALDNSIDNLEMNSREIEHVLEALIEKAKKEKVKLSKEEMNYIQLAIDNLNERVGKLTEE